MAELFISLFVEVIAGIIVSGICKWFDDHKKGN